MNLDLRAFSDESYDKRTFCIAGFIAPQQIWREFEANWNAVLKRHGLYEFKMSDCEQGRGEFREWKDRDAREAVQREFIEVIGGVFLPAVWTALNLDGFKTVHADYKVMRHEGYDDPYFLAFQHQVELMMQVGERATKRRLDQALETVGFVFDAQEEWSGRAAYLYQSLKRSTTLPFVRHLGDIAFNDSKAHPGIQAADLLAYEARRHLTRVEFADKPEEIRWQWRLLHAPKMPDGRNPRIFGRFFPEAAFPTLIELMKREQSA